jgi:hypothetical protein
VSQQFTWANARTSGARPPNHRLQLTRLRGLDRRCSLGDFHRKDSADALAAVRARTMTGREFLITVCDEKFTNEHLSDEGNAFIQWYYGDDKGRTRFYFADYRTALGGGLPTLYHAADTWDNYDRLAPVLGRRYLEWKNRRPRRWWFGRR